MDIPIDIESVTEGSDTVQGMAELKQTLTLLLKQPINGWLQNAGIGSRVAEHTGDDMAVAEGIIATCESIGGIAVEHIEVNLPDAHVIVRYNGEVVDFTFRIADVDK